MGLSNEQGRKVPEKESVVDGVCGQHGGWRQRHVCWHTREGCWLKSKVKHA